MRFSGRQRIRFFVLISVIGLLGTASLVYILLQQRLSNPLTDTYRVSAELPEADGVVAGLGQPVNVAGVKVGSIVDSELARGRALVTLEIERDLLPSVHRGAEVTLEPITPLKDMQIDLVPGNPQAAPLAEGETIPLAGNNSPVPLANLLASLDTDTREYLQTLIASVGEGLDGNGPDLRQTLRAMAPTTRQVAQISRALDGRRRDLSRLVSNLAKVTDAASRDQTLSSLVAAGNQTLEAIAAEDDSLDAALARFPGTLQTASRTLTRAGEFSDQLGPALASLRPAISTLPLTFAWLRPFAAAAASSLEREVRPLVTEIQPLAGNLRTPVKAVTGSAADIWTTLQSTNYGLNVLAHNPKGRDEGGLFWFDWMAHNVNSAFGSVGDAHGGAPRSMILANCQEWAQPLGDISTVLQVATGVATICPVTRSPDEVG